MSTTRRACLFGCVAILLVITFTTAGCGLIFRGKKHAATPVAKSSAAPRGIDVMPAASKHEVASKRSTGRDREREAAMQKELSPQRSAVEWPDPNELRLGAERPAEVAITRQPSDDGIPEANLTRTPAPAAVVEPKEEHPVPVAEKPSAATSVQSSGDATLANHGLSLDDPAPAPAAQAPVAPIADTRKVERAKPQSAPAVDAGELGTRVTQRLRENPGDLSAHLDNQLFKFLSDEKVPDLNTLSTLPAEDRELLSALIDGLSNFRNAVRSDHNLLLPGKVRPILDLASRVRSLADLSIPTIALCRSVKTFGNYEPMDGRFVAGAKNEAILYCEVANVASRQNERGEWESNLSQEAVLYTEDGQRVWSNPRQAVVDHSRNRRHDFFIPQRVTLPPNLTIGRYILKATITDEQVKRVAEATMPVQIVASLGPDQSAPNTPVAGPKDASKNTNEARPASERQLGSPPRSTASLDGNK
jgi:hypothetical protein